MAGAADQIMRTLQCFRVRERRKYDFRDQRLQFNRAVDAFRLARRIDRPWVKAIVDVDVAVAHLVQISEASSIGSSQCGQRIASLSQHALARFGRATPSPNGHELTWLSDAQVSVQRSLKLAPLMLREVREFALDIGMICWKGTQGDSD